VFRTRNSFVRAGALGFVALLMAVPGCGNKSAAPAESGAKQGKSAPTAKGGCTEGLELAPDDPVAIVGGKPITCAELAEEARGRVVSAKNEFEEKVHQIQLGTLENMINERLLEAKAKEAGQTLEEYLEAKTQVPDPTDEQLKQVYDQAVASGQQLPPFEEVKEGIVRYLTEQPRKQAMTQLITSLRDEAKVETKMPPYIPGKVEVEFDGPAKGPATAPVTIVEFSDFECPFCSRAEPTIEKVMAEYGDKVRLVYADYPLPNHAAAPKASEAALCAQDQGKYWEMHSKLFANQRALGIDALKGYATELGLDRTAFDKCLDDGGKAEQIKVAMELGQELGVSGTPAFFINGRMLSGAQPFDRFKELIDHELVAAGIDLPKAEADAEAADPAGAAAKPAEGDTAKN